MLRDSMQEFGDPDSGGILPPPGGGCLHETFDAVAALLGNAVAGVDHGRTITFAQLKVSSDRLARRLYEAGVSRGDRVGVCGGRSLDALVAFLGILKVGAAYLPLDDTSPPRRLQAMAEEAGVQTVVTLPGSVARVRRIRTLVELPPDGLGGVGDPPPRTAVTGQDCAYVMFTSGSTGRPKAVAVPHRGVVALCASDLVHQRPRPEDRVLHAYNLSSDASTIEIWPPLLAGACIVIANREELLSPTALEQRFVEDEVSVAYLTTAVFHHVARVKPEALRRLRFASAGGESMDPALARAVTDACPATTVVNFYGPTENTVVSTAYIVAPDREPLGPMPIGRPLEYATCHIVRPDGTAVAAGEEGELLVGGTGLALGYIGDPDLTARKFVPHPTESGMVVYRTGDRVVRNADGDLEYRGRIDRQIKLRGHRIELEEIEARLRADDRIGEAIVDFDGHSLTGYVTPATPGKPIPTDAVRADLAKWLPAPAALQKLIEVPRLPVNAAGKVDRKLLSQLVGPETTPAPGPALAATPVVGGLLGTLAQIWQNFLRVWPGEDDDFFAVGGDSLLAAQVVTSTLSTLGIEATHGTSLIRCLLNTRTLKGFAAAVSAVNDGATLAQNRPTVDFAAGGPLRPGAARAGGSARRTRAIPQHVLLTGASGFVGAWLLYSQMNRTDAVVHCPVRASSEAHAGARVRSNLTRYGLDRHWDPSRIACFPGDLTDSEADGDEYLGWLGERLDLVIHSAAQVNFLYPYEALREANVEGTRRLVRAGRAAARAGALPVDDRDGRRVRREPGSGPRATEEMPLRGSPRAAHDGLRREQVGRRGGAARRRGAGAAGGDLPPLRGHGRSGHRRLQHRDRDLLAVQVHRGHRFGPGHRAAARPGSGRLPVRRDRPHRYDVRVDRPDLPPDQPSTGQADGHDRVHAGRRAPHRAGALSGMGGGAGRLRRPAPRRPDRAVRAPVRGPGEGR